MGAVHTCIDLQLHMHLSFVSCEWYAKPGVVLQTAWAIRDQEQRLRDSQLAIRGLRKSLQGSDTRHYCLRQRILALEG